MASFGDPSARLRKKLAMPLKGKFLIPRLIGIKTVLWEYSCVEEYFIEFYKGKCLRYSSLLAVLPRN